jgi:hypothetical protein
LVREGSRVGPLPDSVALPPLPTNRTLTLKLFRGLDPCGLGRSPRLPITPRSTARRICLPRLPTGLEGLRPRTYPPASPHRSVTAATGTGLVTRCPSPTPRGLGLGPPHPQLISMAAEPWGIRWGGFAPPSRYSCRHSHSHALQVRFRSPFTAAWDAPLPTSPPATAPPAQGSRLSAPGSRLVPRLRRRSGSHQPFAYGAFTLSSGSFQRPSAKLMISYSPDGPQPIPTTPLNPHQATLARKFTRNFSGSVLLGNTTGRSNSFRLQGYYLLWPYFPESSSSRRFCNSLIGLTPDLVGPTTPPRQRRQALTP